MRANSEHQEANSMLDKMKWLLALVLLAFVIWGNFYFSAPNSIYQANSVTRIAGVVVLSLLALLLILKTTLGKQLMVFAKESRAEVRKVVWPTRRETLQTTLIIAVITTIASLFLWGLDSIVIRLISFITSLGH